MYEFRKWLITPRYILVTFCVEKEMNYFEFNGQENHNERCSTIGSMIYEWEELYNNIQFSKNLVRIFKRHREFLQF